MSEKKPRSGRPNRTRAAPTALRDGVRAFKREAIIKAAIDTFYSNGYQNVTVDDIASAMSVTKAVVYYSFNTKEDILEAIIDRTTELSWSAIDRGVALGATPAQKLALACYSYADHMMKNQRMVGVYFREDRCFSTALRTRTTKVEKSIAAQLAQVIEAGIDCGEFKPCDIRFTAITIMGMIAMAFYWYRDSGRLSRAQLCRGFTEQSLRLVGYEGALALEQGITALSTRSA